MSAGDFNLKRGRSWPGLPIYSAKEQATEREREREREREQAHKKLKNERKRLSGDVSHGRLFAFLSIARNSRTDVVALCVFFCLPLMKSIYKLVEKMAKNGPQEHDEKQKFRGR